MTIIVDFRARRNAADAACSKAPAGSSPGKAPSANLSGGAEIILLPLAWLGRTSRPARRKPLKRRFALMTPVPAGC